MHCRIISPPSDMHDRFFFSFSGAITLRSRVLSTATIRECDFWSERCLMRPRKRIAATFIDSYIPLVDVYMSMHACVFVSTL